MPQEKEEARRKYRKVAASLGSTVILKRAAAHVAAWIAYSPEDRRPGVHELLLLEKLLHNLGRLIPSRLQEILPRVQAVVEELEGDHDSDLLTHEALSQLQQCLKRFRCCRKPGRDHALSAGRSNLPRNFAITKDGGSTGQSTEAVRADMDSHHPSQQHLRLHRKINEWGPLDVGERLECVKKCEEAAKRGCTEVELAERLYSLAGALSAPRLHAVLKDADGTHALDDPTIAATNSKDVDLQLSVRALMLDILRLWQERQCDPKGIRAVLEYIQVKINQFEDKVGDVRSAAAGVVWSSIKSCVDQLLGEVGADMPSESKRVGPARPFEPEAPLRNDDEALAPTRKPRAHGFRRLERQSGTRGITWNQSYAYWAVDFRFEGQRRNRCFAIAPFLKQGFSEEEAVDAALKKAKQYQEELTRQGKLTLQKPRSSSVTGVDFLKLKQKWRVRFTRSGKMAFYSLFDTREEAESRAVDVAAELEKHRETVPVPDTSELRHFAPLGPQRGVTWNKANQCWRATHGSGKSQISRRFRPVSSSDEGVAKAWEQAVAWRRAQKFSKGWQAAKPPNSCH